MLTAQKARISWFLGLQRLIHFPRRFIAPARVLLLRKRTAGLELTGFPEHQLHFRGDADGAVSVGRSAQAGLVPKREAPVLRITDEAQATRVRANPGTPMLSAVLRQHHSSPLPSLAASRPASGSYIGPASATLRTLQSVPDGRKSSHKIAIEFLKATEPSSLAPSSTTATVAAPGGDDRDDILRSTPPASYEALTARERVLAGGQSQVRQRGGDARGPSFSEEASPNEKSPSGNASPLASTIHIDGAVLGRWAVQHLERTLSRPASGMTGVDPRASIPRSRVSPF